jgi:hypothetical protein
VADENLRDKAFREANEAINNGDFDEIKSALVALGFEFRETSNAGHWQYFHRLLRSDSLYRYPRNLYKPHGRRRDTGRVSRIDQTHARQMVSALKALLEEGEAANE